MTVIITVIICFCCTDELSACTYLNSVTLINVIVIDNVCENMPQRRYDCTLTYTKHDSEMPSQCLYAFIFLTSQIVSPFFFSNAYFLLHRIFIYLSLSWLIMTP